MNVSRPSICGLLSAIAACIVLVVTLSHHSQADDRPDEVRRTAEVERQQQQERLKSAEQKERQALERRELERREREAREHREREMAAREQKERAMHERERQERERDEREMMERRQHEMQERRHGEAEERELHRHRVRTETQLLELEMRRKQLDLQMAEMEFELKMEGRISKSDEAAMEAIKRARAYLKPEHAMEFFSSMIEPARSPVVRYQLRLQLAEIQFQLNQTEPGLDQLRELIAK